LYYEALMHGNLTKEDAQVTIDVLNKVLQAKPLKHGQFPIKQVVKLEEAKTYIHQIKTFNTDDQNSAIQVYFEVGPDDIQLNAMIDVFSQCSSSSAYSQLRTTEQLGYIVWSGAHRENGVHGFRVIIQSDTKDPVVLDERIETWIESFKEEFTSLSEEDYRKFIDGLVVQKLEKDKSLKEETSRWRSETQFPRSHRFNRAEAEAEAIQNLTQNDVLQFYMRYIAKGGSLRKKLSVQIFGKAHELPQQTTLDPSTVFIKDITSFKKGSTLYPLLYDLSQHIGK